jgi:hypothetical protein
MHMGLLRRRLGNCTRDGAIGAVDLTARYQFAITIMIAPCMVYICARTYAFDIIKEDLRKIK